MSSKIIGMLSIAFISLANSSYAATSYNCGSVSLTVQNNKIRIFGLASLDNQKSVIGSQTRYSPRPEHAGSTRYDISSICGSSGDVYAILDKELSSGKQNGELTIQSTCDGDGGAPTYDRYTCESK
jgi:hypothetical protein